MRSLWTASFRCLHHTSLTYAGYEVIMESVACIAPTDVAPISVGTISNATKGWVSDSAGAVIENPLRTHQNLKRG